jgi:hypothetical protein
MDDQELTLLSRRVAARRQARVIVELIQEEVISIHADAVDSFWHEIKKIIPPEKVPEYVPDVPKPFTDLEAQRFGQNNMPFGEYAGRKVDDVPLGYLEWLADQKFNKHVARYVANRRIRAERESTDREDES